MTSASSTLLLLLLGGASIVLGLLLAGQLRQRRALRGWLIDPTRRDIPDGRGAWQEVFSLLQRWRREELRERAALGGGLQRFRQAAQALPDGVILLDGECRIEWLNTAASEHFGLNSERDLGTLIEQLFRQSSFHDFLENFRKPERSAAREALQPGDASAADESATDGALLLPIEQGGSKRYYALQLVAFADAGILLLSRDMTESVRIDAVRRDFIANVSHELRTPLTVISGFLEQLTGEDAPTGKAAEKFLQLMSEQATRMNRLVADLLTLSRLETDNEPPRDEVVDVAAMLETLSAEAAALSAGRHHIVLEDKSAGCLRGNADELRSAFSNLLSNAIRYTPAGGRIALDWRLVDACPVFSVSDTGIGIPAEHISRLTERFYRVDKGRSTATGGTGLGLAIVKHVLARHQGTLAIRSEPGKGSVFSVHMPQTRYLPQTAKNIPAQ